jgi:pimeloyl-ACP methyl ester carboxylesterase
MSNNSIKKRLVALASAAALITGVTAVVPAQAADPACTTAAYVTTCLGATSDTAPYMFITTAAFNGTVLLWSHGLRPNVDIPVGIPGYGGYKVTNTPEPAPGGDKAIIGALLGAGYGIAGSGFSRQGVNVQQAVAANVELIDIFKKKNPTTKKVVAWGASLGTLITQTLAEKHPELIDSVALVCPATAPTDALISYFGDFMWGFKTFFDPTIKGFGYSAGAAGYGEAMGDLVKFFTALGKLQAGLVSGAWPDTSSPAGKALETAKIPSRSALTLIGLMAGVPMRSEHIDGTSGPTGSEQLFPLAIAPAVAVLENAGTVGLAEVLLMSDGEAQSGGIVFDNTKTDYASRVDADKDVYTFALSGNTAVSAMLGVLAASPRVTGSAAAMAKAKTLLAIDGSVKHPTVLLTTEADQFTVAGAGQWMIDGYADQYAAAKAAALKAYQANKSYTAPTNNLVALWAKTGAKYTKFTATGSPDLSATAGAGTGHCKYTPAQYVAVAKMAANVANTGKFPSGGPIATAARKVGLSYDNKFRVPLFRSLG